MTTDFTPTICCFNGASAFSAFCVASVIALAIKSSLIFWDLSSDNWKDTVSTRFAPEDTAASMIFPAKLILSVWIDNMLETR